MKTQATWDIEIYRNYLLIAFKNPETNKVLTFEAKGEQSTLTHDQINKIKYIFSTREIFGFNSNSFDVPVLLLALSGAKVIDVKRLADEIINNNLHQWQSLNMIDQTVPNVFDHFDLKEVAIGVNVSLKLYGGRLGSNKLQELPFDPKLTLSDEQMEAIKVYCENDLDTNIDLYNAIKPAIDLRKEMSANYGIDLRSKSDAQIAEALLKMELEKIKGEKIRALKVTENQFKYQAPQYIEFKTKELQDLFEEIKATTFTLNNNGSLDLPEVLKKAKIKLGNSTYKLGIGGIHSTEKKQSVVANAGQVIADRDVTSYYPSMIINNKWYPPQLGKEFLSLYESIYKERVAAKKSGNKTVADTYKIILNGSFGKLGSKYSILYAPNLLLNVTLTGQLSLLMLIEELELNGISVISANTDGFVSFMADSQYKLYDSICNTWELNTDLLLEETLYKALHSRDVNNYCAITTDNKIKGKGIFTLGLLSKNPQYEITIEAAIAYLKDGVDPEKTIRQCNDIRKFACIRTVKGGGKWQEKYLGKVVRWVYSTKGEPILYASNNNKVATSDGALPIMNLSEVSESIWDELDYDKYLAIVDDILKNVGVK